MRVSAENVSPALAKSDPSSVSFVVLSVAVSSAAVVVVVVEFLGQLNTPNAAKRP